MNLSRILLFLTLLLVGREGVDAADIKEARSITFDDLAACQALEYISVRGFLYQSDDGRWILAAEPHLKTCCIGAKHKKGQQIVLIGTFDASKINLAVRVRGYLTPHFENSEYKMEDVQIEENKIRASFWVATICLAAISAICLVGVLLKKQIWSAAA